MHVYFVVRFKINDVAKVSYFFISLEKFIFDHFSAKIEWVSENGVFFSSAVFFFRPLKMSEWVKCKLFPGKKKQQQQKKWEKKTPPKCEKLLILPFLTIFDLFLGTSKILGEWVACKLFLGKKNNCFFFLKQEKKNKVLRIWVSEWEVNFSGEKKYDTFGSGSKKSL